MFAPFPQEEAFSVCQKIFDGLQEGLFVLEQISQVSEERLDQGVMLGVLVCETVTLACVSGTAKQLSTAPGTQTDIVFVPPVVDSKKITEALSQNDLKIHQLTDEIQKGKACGTDICELKKTRLALCNESLKKVNSLYRFHCADGKLLPLEQILKNTNKGNPAPTGTGECAAPKLLNYAYAHGFAPRSMCEVYLQLPLKNKLEKFSTGDSFAEKECGKVYGPCDERCALLLPEMLGLKILYRDQHIIVVDKQSGVLSVPGRGPDKQDCIVNRVRRLFPDCIQQPAVHRLDMETSGLLVLAFTKEAHRELNRQFEAGEVKKEYVALLDGVLAKKGIAPQGQMELFFRLDVENRPHQIWDEVYGKRAITQWEILDVEKYHSPDGQTKNATRVRFIPHTGRTHQLRLASADSHGFGIPIIGDTLYGTCLPGERLMLHAKNLSFTHPATGERMDFECLPDF